jgi:septal ring-binding cell division protein DamX
MLLRATIVLLCVLNLGAAAWWVLHAPLPASAVPSAPPGAARLRLAAEAGMAASRTVAPAREATPPARATTVPAVAAPPASTASAPMSSAGAAACEGGAGPADGWRVYLPRLPSPEAAAAVAKRIGESGFSDYLVVRDGDDANTIALGRYGTEDAAQRRAASLRAAGFPARCARIPKATPA